MNHHTLHRNYDIVFSRWSRKGYAVLASLGRVVKIGHLPIDICRQADLKNGACGELTDSSLKEIDPEESDSMEPMDFLPDGLMELLYLLGMIPSVAMGQYESIESICFLGVFI